MTAKLVERNKLVGLVFRSGREVGRTPSQWVDEGLRIYEFFGCAMTLARPAVYFGVRVADKITANIEAH